ncbi:NgoFVII family restriction endonuclease [Methanofervidicoccus sp. A16]|uniref:helicase-related protein n=1 Tax=Methanofervidicoccus sp. A16 TaxID=2607662 RepID=UPI00118950EE|nr:helicase-related protein [Methanofervidicoccus sp. A16]AXI25459.1 NgoFVII family restriction endonuclease [Methanofervidicoccus sp. A16]
MNKFIVDNLAGILPYEKSVLDVFRDRIKRSIEKNQEISFKIAVGFFFFEGFQRLYPELKELYERGLLREFKLVMGPETKKSTKEILESLKNEGSVLNNETFNFIKELYNRGKFDFRIFLDRNLHIKLYLFEVGEELEIWTGSANLTAGGLEENIELIVPVEDNIYREFFNEIWKRSTDKVEDLKVIDVIREGSISEVIYLHPRDFIVNLIKILDKKYLIKNISADLSYLAEFQNMSYYLCVDKLNRYGGCILANSFGLGKTDVGCTVAKYYRELGKKVLIIHPPVLREHWENTLKKVGLKEGDVELLSRGKLQKRDFDYGRYLGVDLIVVDEAHHFRVSKPKSNRRENLENIVKINPKSHVLLITATPINTSLLDFIELIKLFVKGNYKERFESEGILAKMKEVENEIRKRVITSETVKKLNELIRIFSVRVEWPDLPIYFKEDLKKIAGVEDIEEPDVVPVNYKYDEEIAGEIFDKVVPFLSEVNFEYTKLWEREYREDKNLIWWYKWRLYKRLESSIIGFKISLENILEKNRFLLGYLREVTVNKEYWENTRLFSKERLENIKNTFLSLSDSKRDEILRRIEEDIDLIKRMLKSIEGIKDLQERDEKIAKLLEILEKEGKPTIVFSESRDTVIYIGKRLKRYGKFKFALAYGGEDPIDEEGEEFHKVDKEKVEKEFNEGKFDILITTDVLSEGVNLPRADVVVNFDLHYNPVRLIQRVGRAIRINNPKKVIIYNFVPDERIDKELELCDRLAERVENIISTIGLDFLIWAMEEGKLREVSERNRKRTVELIREYKCILASRHPEELGMKLSPTLSKEDKVLREFIKFWSISEETVESRSRVYRKPIFTSLEVGKGGYFVVFKYRGSVYTLGELIFSEKRGTAKLSREELEEIKGLVLEKCLEMDREFLKVSYGRKDRISMEIERMVEKMERLKEVFEGVDITTLPKREREDILEILRKVEKIPPWRRGEEIKKLEGKIERLKSRGHQRILEEPEILAVLKYV